MVWVFRLFIHRERPRYLEKFKINISTRRIQTKLSTRKRLNTRSILLYSLLEYDEKFRRYSTFSRYQIHVWQSGEYMIHDCSDCVMF
jgi:hypothetical protein